MTKEKLQFLLPVVFTIGPDVNQRGANTKGAPNDHQEAAVQDGDEPHGLLRSGKWGRERHAQVRFNV